MFAIASVAVVMSLCQVITGDCDEQEASKDYSLLEGIGVSGHYQAEFLSLGENKNLSQLSVQGLL